MSSDVAIHCAGLGKAYQLYAKRTDRLKQVAFGGFRRFYQEYWVLRDIDLKVMRGECVGIIGPNGAGKTTLLQLLCGITRPTCGELEVNGRIAPILALGSGFVGDISGRENVLIAGAILGLRRAEIMRDEALAVGDAVFREKCLRFMETFRRGGTLVVASHEDDQIAALCDRVIWVDDGQIRASGKTADMLRLYRDSIRQDDDDGSRFRFDSTAHAPPS